MPLLPFLARSSAALVAVGDPSRDRTVYATIVLLVALGLTMIMLAVWLVRNTRPDPEVLAPLERMGQRKWRRADPVWQRRRLDEVRPGGADPLEPMSAPPDTDAEFELGPQPIGFDDLVVSNETADAPATELPAPAVGAVAVNGPGDVETDTGDAAAADESMAGSPEPVDAVDPAEVVDEDADGGTAADESTTDDDDDDDDDEDITGEQDTDDFFAVFDQVDEREPDVETDESDGSEESVPEPVDEAVSEPESEQVDDAVGAPESETVVPSDDEAQADPESEPDDDAQVSDPEVESDVDPASEPDVESDVDAASASDVVFGDNAASEPDVESGSDRSDDPDVDQRDGPG